VNRKRCRKGKSANLSEDAFWSAINTNGDVEVMHVSDSGDHGWKLDRQEKIYATIGPKGQLNSVESRPNDTTTVYCGDLTSERVRSKCLASILP